MTKGPWPTTGSPRGSPERKRAPRVFVGGDRDAFAGAIEDRQFYRADLSAALTVTAPVCTTSSVVWPVGAGEIDFVASGQLEVPEADGSECFGGAACAVKFAGDDAGGAGTAIERRLAGFAS